MSRRGDGGGGGGAEVKGEGARNDDGSVSAPAEDPSSEDANTLVMGQNLSSHNNTNTDHSPLGGDGTTTSSITRTSIQTRRASFRRSIEVQRQDGGRKALKAVIQAAERQSREEEEERDRRQPQSPKYVLPSFSKANSLRNVMGAVQRHFRDRHATRIQALYRGYHCRRDGNMRPTSPQKAMAIVRLKDAAGATPKGRHYRISSEITMSDFEESLLGDSFSLDSLDASPRTNMRRNNEEQGAGCFQNSSLTETTAASEHSESDVPHHTSFSSLFSSDTSQDVPMRMPFRKATPPKSQLPDLRNRTHISPATSSSTQPDLRVPDMPSMRTMRFDSDADAEVARATSAASGGDGPFDSSITSLPQLKPRKTSKEAWERTHQGLHQSFSTFDRDEPARPPTRELSPTRQPLSPTNFEGWPSSSPIEYSASAADTTIANPDNTSQKNVDRNEDQEEKDHSDQAKKG